MPPPRRRANTTKFAVGFLAGLVIVVLMNLNLIGEVRNQSSDSGGPGWTRILGGSIGRVAAGSVVLVHPDRSRDVTVYRQAAHEICARMRYLGQSPEQAGKGVINETIPKMGGPFAWSSDGKIIYFDKQEQVNTISMFEHFR